MNSLKVFFRAKYLLLFLAVPFFTSISINTKAQQSDITLSIDVVESSSSQTADGEIQIEVLSGGSGFKYMLYDKEPWKGGEKLIPDVNSGTSYSFTNLRSGKYYVCVQNKDEVTKCTTVTIEPKN